MHKRPPNQDQPRNNQRRKPAAKSPHPKAAARKQPQHKQKQQHSRKAANKTVVHERAQWVVRERAADANAVRERAARSQPVATQIAAASAATEPADAAAFTGYRPKTQEEAEKAVADYIQQQRLQEAPDPTDLGVLQRLRTHLGIDEAAARFILCDAPHDQLEVRIKALLRDVGLVPRETSFSLAEAVRTARSNAQSDAQRRSKQREEFERVARSIEAGSAVGLALPLASSALSLLSSSTSPSSSPPPPPSSPSPSSPTKRGRPARAQRNEALRVLAEKRAAGDRRAPSNTVKELNEPKTMQERGWAKPITAKTLHHWEEAAEKVKKPSQN
jgi:hypothetical protein